MFRRAHARKSWGKRIVWDGKK